MELGGVSLPGQGQSSGGAFLVKDLSVFETQLGGLKAFIMVSDGTAEDESGGAASRLAVKAADTYLESLLMKTATGQTVVFDPALTLKTIVAEANNAILTAAAEPGALNMAATFGGALVSADKLWLGRIGDCKGYLLRGDDARELVVSSPKPPVAVAEVAPLPDDAPAAEEVGEDAAEVAASVLPVAAPALGHQGVEVGIGSVSLSPTDAVVLLGRGASSALSRSDIPGLTCAQCDAHAASAVLAEAGAKADSGESMTVAIWSADSALYAQAPEPEPTPAVAVAAAGLYAAPVAAAADDAWLTRGERTLLWVMSAWILVAFLVLGIGMAISKVTAPTRAAEAESAVQAAEASAAATAAAAAAAVPVAPPEYPKKLTVPKNVKGGLLLRRMATTLGGTNELAALKGGAQIQAIGVVQGTDDKGGTRDFYVIQVSDVSKSQVVKDPAHPWPPKNVKKVFVFAGSFDAKK